MIRIERESGNAEELSGSIRAALSDGFGKESHEIRRVETVGPQVGKDLKLKALYAILYALGGILIYISLRFEFRYALGAIIATGICRFFYYRDWDGQHNAQTKKRLLKIKHAVLGSSLLVGTGFVIAWGA